MKKVIANMVPAALEVMMWITPVAGAMAGISIAEESNFNIVAGAIAGVGVGVVLNIYLWGVIFVFVDMKNRLQTCQALYPQVFGVVNKAGKGEAL